MVIRRRAVNIGAPGSQLQCVAHLGAGRPGGARTGDRSRVAHGMWEAAMHIPIVIGTRQWRRTNTPFSFGTVTIVDETAPKRWWLSLDLADRNAVDLS